MFIQSTRSQPFLFTSLSRHILKSLQSQFSYRGNPFLQTRSVIKLFEDDYFIIYSAFILYFNYCMVLLTFASIFYSIANLVLVSHCNNLNEDLKTNGFPTLLCNSSQQYSNICNLWLEWFLMQHCVIRIYILCHIPLGLRKPCSTLHRHASSLIPFLQPNNNPTMYLTILKIVERLCSSVLLTLTAYTWR